MVQLERAKSVCDVTLMTGSLTFSILSLAPNAIVPGDMGWAIAGIACIGFMNFGLSFALPLITVIRARDIKRAWLKELAEGIWLAMRDKPLSFILPS